MATISRVHTFSTGEVLTAANLNGELNLIVTAINGNIDAANVDTSAIPTLTATQTLTNKTLTSPKIGTAVLDTAGAELIKLTATGSAVNELTIANAATGNSPTISSTGDDTNIDLTLSGKGTGKVIVSGDLQVSGDDLFMGTNTSGHVLIADGNNFNPTALSGDVTVNSSGTTAIESGVIVNADVNASAAIAQSKLALAVTTSEIAAATLVTESEGIGSNDNDTTLPTSAAVKDYVDTQILTEDTLAELNDTTIGSLASGHLLIYDGTDSWDNKAVTGDISIDSSGVTAIGSGVIVDADVNSSAAIAQSKLDLAITTSQIAAATLVTESEGIGSNDNDTTLPTSAAVKDYVDTQILTEDTLTELNDTNISSASSGQLLIYDGTDSWDNQSLSGDVTVNASGVTAISSDVIVNADIKSDAAIADSKLATISTSNKVSGSAVQLASTTAIEDSSGLQIKSAIAGTGLSLSSQVLSVDAAQTQITSVGTLSSLTVGGNIVSDTDGTDDLGLTGTRWRYVYADDIAITNDLAVTEGGTGASTASAARTNLGLGSIATQASDSVSITGGSVTGITDITVADGGTGSSSASGARPNLGVSIGSDVQAYNAGLADIAALATTDGNIIVGSGSNWVAESGATARTSLGLGSIATQAADNVSISGGSLTGMTSYSGGSFSGTTGTFSGDLAVDTDTLFVDVSEDRVGINTSSADASLHVESASVSDLVKVEGTGTDSNPNIQIANDARAYNLQVVGARSDAFEIWDRTAGATRLTVDTSGQVGVGLAPSYTLDVQAVGSSFNPARFSGHSASIDTFIYTDTNYWGFGDAASYGGNLWGGHKGNNELYAYVNGANVLTIEQDSTDVKTTIGRGQAHNGKAMLVLTSTTSTDEGGEIQFHKNSATTCEIGHESAVLNSGFSSDLFLASDGNIDFAAGGTTQRMTLASTGLDVNGIANGNSAFKVTNASGNKTSEFEISGSGHGAMKVRASNGVEKISLSAYENSHISAGFNMGFGTLSPFGIVDIAASGRNAAGDISDVDDYALVIRCSSTTNEGNGIAFANDDGSVVGGSIIHQDKGSANTGDLVFHTRDTGGNVDEAMRINNSQQTEVKQLGIGIANPTRLLHLSSTGGTFARFTSENTDDFSIGANTNGFAVYNETDSNYPLVITHDGRYGFGTASPVVQIGAHFVPSVGTESYMNAQSGYYVGLHPNSANESQHIDAHSNGAGTSSIYIGNEVIQTSSDIRAKKNITDYSESALSVLDKARVVEFEYRPEVINDESEYGPASRGKYVGLIAQEMIEYARWAVNDGDGDPDGEHIWTAKYELMVPLLIKAVQELTQRVTELENN